MVLLLLLSLLLSTLFLFNSVVWSMIPAKSSEFHKEKKSKHFKYRKKLAISICWKSWQWQKKHRLDELKMRIKSDIESISVIHVKSATFFIVYFVKLNKKKTTCSCWFLFSCFRESHAFVRLLNLRTIEIYIEGYRLRRTEYSRKLTYTYSTHTHTHRMVQKKQSHAHINVHLNPTQFMCVHTHAIQTLLSLSPDLL